jgi:hypothetical protein
MKLNNFSLLKTFYVKRQYFFQNCFLKTLLFYGAGTRIVTSQKAEMKIKLVFFTGL